MFELLLLSAALAAFLIYSGIVMPFGSRRAPNLPAASLAQYRARSIGKNKALDGLANASVRRALRTDSLNAKYLRQLRQANWYWEPGEPAIPNPKAPFWNLETLWGEKIFGALVYGPLVAVGILVAGLLLSVSGEDSMLLFLIAAAFFGGMVGLVSYTSPDSAVAAAARKRQSELALEMGFRLAELRAEVMAGNTIQRAIRNMSSRPGGPFVEELCRAVAVLDVTKDDALAMDQLIERNEGNELLAEFANSLKMVSRQGGQIGPVLNVLSDLAQQRLRLTIQAQARKNLQEMTRPIGLSSLIVTSLLIIAPALTGVMSAMTSFGR